MTEIRILCSDRNEEGAPCPFHRTQIWIDGVEQKGIRAIRFTHHAGNSPDLNIEWGI